MKIDVWSDYACPFCWIGEARLVKALEEMGIEDDAELNHRAFELDPHAPQETDETGLETIARRYAMPLDEARKMFARIGTRRKRGPCAQPERRAAREHVQRPSPDEIRQGS